MFTLVSHEFTILSGFHKQPTMMCVLLCLSCLNPSFSLQLFDALRLKYALKSKWTLQPVYTSWGQRTVVLFIFHVQFNGTSILSVRLNVLVENYLSLKLCLRFNFHTHCAVWAFSSLSSWVSLDWNLALGHKKSIVWVSHGWWCFLRLYLCTPTVSPFIET